MSTGIGALNNKDVSTPFMCDNNDEFIKSMFIITTSIPSMLKRGKISEEDACVMYTDMFKMMAHDYMALVMAGKIEAYEFEKDSAEQEYKDMRKMFEGALSELNVTLAMNGVPVKECENGKVEIDYEKLAEERAKESKK